MANSPLETQKDLIKRLLANLPAGFTTSTIKLPNATFTTPTDDKWLRATVLFDEAANVTPDNYQRIFGIFVIDSFVPKGSGDQAQLADAELLRTTFQNVEFGQTKTQETSIQTIGETESWYQVQISTNFYLEGAI
jgi:hypothetical protein